MNSQNTRNFLPIAIIAFIFAFIAGFAPAAASANADLADGFITGTVWADSNRNGIMEPNELPLANHEVYLQRVDGQVNGAMVAVVFSDADGMFKFENLEFGEYQVFPDGGEFALVDVQSVSATANVDLPVAQQMNFIFLPTLLR
ncbi:MAG: SdrD B-like domain-containing protein [Caldilineaceae bacterium]